jgi:cell division protein FtsZ
MVMPGLINLDFADVRSVMREMGKAMMGTGEAEGDGRALEAAQKAIANPLLDGVSMAGAKGVIISITGGEDMRLMEVDEAANHIRELVDPDANIIWGSAFNDSLDGKIRVSVVATGIDSSGEMAAQATPATRSFSFAPARTATPAPVAEEAFEPVVEEEPATDALADEAHDPAPGFSLSDTVDVEAAASDEEPMELSQVAASYDDTAEELVLDAPEPAAADFRTASASGGDAGAGEETPARSIGGGTLFERMSRLSRGANPPEGDDGEKDDGVDIPRFLGRQNNQ